MFKAQNFAKIQKYNQNLIECFGQIFPRMYSIRWIQSIDYINKQDKQAISLRIIERLTKMKYRSLS